jgi:hypothetical protein
MRFGPDGVHRVPVGEGRPATWYEIWLGRPHAEGSVIIGRTRRLRRHRWHRVFTEDGTDFTEIEGHVAAQEWLLKHHREHAPPD